MINDEKENYMEKMYCKRHTHGVIIALYDIVILVYDIRFLYETTFILAKISAKKQLFYSYILTFTGTPLLMRKVEAPPTLLLPIFDIFLLSAAVCFNLTLFELGQGKWMLTFLILFSYMGTDNKYLCSPSTFIYTNHYLRNTI